MARVKVTEWDYVMWLDDFIDDCMVGALMDYDGFGHPIDSDGFEDDDFVIRPSRLDDIPSWAVQVAWYNR